MRWRSQPRLHPLRERVRSIWGGRRPGLEWEFGGGRRGGRGPAACRGAVQPDTPTASAPSGYGISLRWARDARRADPHEWVVEGDFPVFRLKNLAAARRGDAYLLYGEQRYGINLVWGRRPAGGNFFLEPLAEPALPDAGDYVPGEASISTRRPQTWAVEWDGREGLDFEAYATPIRSPYIQNVTCDAATVLWRVGIPKGWDPRAWAGRLQARAWVAPAGTATTGGTRYRTGDATRPIEAGDATGTYQYESGVTFDHDVPSGSGENDYWLNRLSDRPVIRFRVTFRDLRPGTVYHYRVECDGVADGQDRQIANLVLADDVTFRTAPDPTGNPRVRFVAMGDLGPGDGQPSYFYDVFDLFHNVCRSRGPHLWLALGDIDNDTDGHPNAMDPFFFHVYNAYHGRKDPRLTSHTRAARRTTVKAFRSPPYYGLLGGLPVYPTFGNHDICNKGGPRRWTGASLTGKRLPGRLRSALGGLGRRLGAFQHGQRRVLLHVPPRERHLPLSGDSRPRGMRPRQRANLDAGMGGASGGGAARLPRLPPGGDREDRRLARRLPPRPPRDHRRRGEIPGAVPALRRGPGPGGPPAFLPAQDGMERACGLPRRRGG